MNRKSRVLYLEVISKKKIKNLECFWSSGVSEKV